jgi:hypothetical protein
MKGLFLFLAMTFSLAPATAFATESSESASPVVVVTVNGTQIPIECNTVETVIDNMAATVRKAELELSSLRNQRRDNTISFDDNNKLFEAELELGSVQQIIAVHRYGRYFCLNAEKIPKAEVVMPDGMT